MSQYWMYDQATQADYAEPDYAVSCLSCAQEVDLNIDKRTNNVGETDAFWVSECKHCGYYCEWPATLLPDGEVAM